MTDPANVEEGPIPPVAVALPFSAGSAPAPLPRSSDPTSGPPAAGPAFPFGAAPAQPEPVAFVAPAEPEPVTLAVPAEPEPVAFAASAGPFVTTRETAAPDTFAVVDPDTRTDDEAASVPPPADGDPDNDPDNDPDDDPDDKLVPPARPKRSKAAILLSVAVVLLLAATTVMSVLYVQEKDHAEQLDSRNSSLSSDLYSTRNELSSTKDKLTTAEKDRDSAKSSLSSAQSSLSSLRSDASDCQKAFHAYNYAVTPPVTDSPATLDELLEAAEDACDDL